MPNRNRKKKTEDTGPPANGWIVTFSDCMTLLLCFFVLLLTFSSFDEATLERLNGAFQSIAKSSILTESRKNLDSMLERNSPTVERTERGSRQRTEKDLENVRFPDDPPPVLDIDAYRDRRVFYIPSDRLFLGKRGVIAPGGRERLGLIAAFLHKMPCRVIVAESTGSDLGGTEARRISAERAWAILRYFVQEEGLPRELFNMSVQPVGRGQGEGPSVEISLLNEQVVR